MAVKAIEAQKKPTVITFLTCKSMYTRLQNLVEEHIDGLDAKFKDAIRYAVLISYIFLSDQQLILKGCLH